jgi:hypothetical protein
MAIFESLDFLYVPAHNIDESIKYYTNVLDGKLLWKIHAYGFWVACINIVDEDEEKEEEKQQQRQQQPYILLANHIDKKDLIMIYRVKNMEKAASDLKSRGWIIPKSLEIPNGPCHTFRDPADNHIAIYENRRPYVMEQFKGRIDSG